MSRKINQGAKVNTEEFQNFYNAEGKLIITDINISLPKSVHSRDSGDKSMHRKHKAAMLYRNNRLQAIRIIPRESSQVGEIYIGKIKNITVHPEACFVEIGGKQTCFLPMSEACTPFILNRPGADKLKAGDELLVQITKDAQKNKLSGCTTKITLATDYVALSAGTVATNTSDNTSGSQKVYGVFGKINYSDKLSPDQKRAFQEYIQQFSSDTYEEPAQLNHPKQIPVPNAVIRTKARELAPEQLMQALLAAYQEYITLFQTASTRTCFTCIRSMPRTYEQLLNELALPTEYSEIITDDPEIHDYLTEYLSYQATNMHTLRLYEDSLLSLNRLYGLDAKVEEALGRRIWLKSGANLIIEPTEAMTVIDVNSAKKDAYKANQDESYQINAEAAEEIALQLRLRNLSGIIIVDFINMKDKELEKSLLAKLKEVLGTDPVKTKVIDITSLGLAEITRKKVHKPLTEQILS